MICWAPRRYIERVLVNLFRRIALHEDRIMTAIDELKAAHAAQAESLTLLRGAVGEIASAYTNLAARLNEAAQAGDQAAIGAIAVEMNANAAAVREQAGVLTQTVQASVQAPTA